MHVIFNLVPRAVVVSALLVVAAGCAQKPVSLYHWGGYTDQVHAHFKNAETGPEQQIIALEAENEKARASGKPLPPGFHAHLGMLYAQTGRDDQVLQQLETEKTLFPESSGYMDFLIARYIDRGAAR